MSQFTESSEVEAALTRLSEREDGPFVVRLAREPGRRESRYAHLFSGAVAGGAQGQSSDVEFAAQDGVETAGTEPHTLVSTPETAFPALRQDQRLARLEEEVRALRAELNDLRARLGG
jgi:uncharacterized protein YceH (UPF0502 family)